MWFWGRWHAATSLDGITLPTFACVEGRVASIDEIVSPISGVRAAIIRWFLVARAAGVHVTDNGRPVYTPVRTGYWGDGVSVQCGAHRVSIPIDTAFTIEGAFDLQGGTPLPVGLPAAFGEMVAAIPVHQGSLLYQETFLRRGELVRLEAHFAPSPSRGGGAYRGGDADFVVRSELGPVRLIDLSVV